MEKADVCIVKSVSCTKSGTPPNIVEKCHLACYNPDKSLAVIIKGEETKDVQPGKALKVMVEEPSWGGIVPPSE